MLLPCFSDAAVAGGFVVAMIVPQMVLRQPEDLSSGGPAVVGVSTP